MSFWLRKLTEKESDAHPNEVKVDPGHVDQLIQIPLVVGGNGAAVREVGDDIQLLDGDLVNLVQGIDAGDVDPVSLDDINQVIGRGITAEHEIRIVNLVLPANGLDLLCLNVGH